MVLRTAAAAPVSNGKPRPGPPGLLQNQVANRPGAKMPETRSIPPYPNKSAQVRVTLDSSVPLHPFPLPFRAERHQIIEDGARDAGIQSVPDPDPRPRFARHGIVIAAEWMFLIDRHDIV